MVTPVNGCKRFRPNPLVRLWNSAFLLCAVIIFLAAGCKSSTPNHTPSELKTSQDDFATPTFSFLPLPTALPLPTFPGLGQAGTGLQNPTPDMRTLEIHLQRPMQGQLYHGVYPGGQTGEEDDITLFDLLSYEQLAGKKTVWTYFSHNWYRGHGFPETTASWIRRSGGIPFIRLMLRSAPEPGRADPLYSLERILSGAFDQDLISWMRSARSFGTPLLVEYGTECNGNWFPWNASWNGRETTSDFGSPEAPDGPERFKAAYIHIIELARQEGAVNIAWVFHVNSDDYPDEKWNRLEDYYPGDEYIDWLALSVYGAQTPSDEGWPAFRDVMDEAYRRLEAVSTQRPILLAEFGVTSGHPGGKQEEWARAALADLVAGRWPRLAGFSWWNETWQNDDDRSHDTHMRLQDNPELARVFKELIRDNPNILGEPIWEPPYNVSLPSILHDAPPLEPAPTGTPTQTLWLPEPGLSWQWQLTDPPVNTAYNVSVYDIDLFDNDHSVVDELHKLGKKVICYISMGSWEEWRPDAHLFPSEVIGKDYEGWEGEKWLDIRRIDLLAPVLTARLDLCKEKGFEAVEPDNIDGYANDTGFPITYQDQIAFTTWLAEQAHDRGLSIGLKNNSDQVLDLLSFFDWALTEDCFAEGWCEAFSPFIKAGKAVFAAEYTDTGVTLDAICPQAAAMGFSVILKDRELGELLQTCP